jgi:hypothetical protein
VRSMGRRDAGNSPHACLHSRRLNPQRQIAESVRMAQRTRENGMEQRESSARNDNPMTTPNLCHSAQQLGCSCRRIVLGHCVAPGDPRNAALFLSLFHQSVNQEAVVA